MVELQSCAGLVNASALCAIEQEVQGEGISVIAEITAELQRERRKNAELLERISILEAQIQERKKLSLPTDGQGGCPNAMERSMKKLKRQKTERSAGTENGNISKSEMATQQTHDSQCSPPGEASLEDCLVSWMRKDENHFFHYEKFKGGDSTADCDDTDDSDDEDDDYHEEDDINSGHKVGNIDETSITAIEQKEYPHEGGDEGLVIPCLESSSGVQLEPTFSIVSQETNENQNENGMAPDTQPGYDKRELKRLDRKETKNTEGHKELSELLSFDKEVCHSLSLQKKPPKVAFCPKEVKKIIESNILLQKNAQSHTIRKIIVFASLGIRHGCEDMYELDFNHFSILRKGEPYVSPTNPGEHALYENPGVRRKVFYTNRQNPTLCPVQVLEEEKAMRPSDASCPSCLFLCIKYGGRTRNLPQNEYVRQRMGRNKLKSFGPLMCRIAMLVHIRSGSFFFKALGITLLFMAGFPDDLVQRETKYRKLDLLQKYYRIISQVVAQPAFLYHSCLEDNRDNYISDGTFKANLNHLLHSISNTSNEIINDGFYSSSYGQNINAVHAIGLCRGDVHLDVCRGCLYNASYLLPELCPDHKEAIGWYEHCMLRYSNRSILGVLETSPNFTMWGINNVSANYADLFFDVVRSLLEGLRSLAAAPYSLSKFASGDADVSDLETIFALVQCTPDLSEQECNDCLLGASEGIPRCCDGKKGGRIARPSCDIRFEVYPFYNYTTNLLPPTRFPTPTEQPRSGPYDYPPNPSTERPLSPTIRKVVVLASITFLGLISSITGIYIRAKRGRKKVDNEIIGSIDSILFDFDNIKVATNNFSEANKIRESEFGTVYKGRFSDKVITVKRLSMDYGQTRLEFEKEALSLTKLQHRNIVKLLGCSIQGNEILLIHDFVPDTSLDHYLSDPLKLATLDWEMRYKIIRGIAQAVLYLHEEYNLCLNHGLKASNIFLDEEMNPKISDFCLKSLHSLDQVPENTSRIGRTNGAPDVMHMPLISMKSDVFNFGVLVLEIVCGQKNNCFRNEGNADNLLSCAWKNFTEGTASEIIDPTILMPDGSTSEIMNCILAALLCAEANEADRPTMASVVTMLDGFDKHGSIEIEIPLFEDDHKVLGRRTFRQSVRRLFWKQKSFRVLQS